jgi:polysaccharide deacetylase 2 family uncharacterized protein YibQ
MFRLPLLSIIVFSASIILSLPANAEKFASIIIDDVGNHFRYGQDVINLPAALTIAILPQTTYAKNLARLAAKNNKEVMLHLPMQSVVHHKQSPGTLDLHMTKNEFRKQLLVSLNSVPYVRGVNNHMGSLLTRHPGHMNWLMDELSKRGNLYFIDSRTTSKSIAAKIALEYDMPHLSRDFFLDSDHKKTTIRQQFNLFIKKINQRGYALAIAHPYPSTIKFLQENLGELNQHGITLLPVSELIGTATRLTNHRKNHHVACTGPSCSRL